MRVILYPNPGDARGLNYGISDLLVFDGRSRASLRSRHLCIHAHHRGAGVAQGGSAQCPRRTRFRQWAQAAGRNNVAVGANAAVSEWPPPRVAQALSAVVARRLRERSLLWRTGASLRKRFASEGSRPAPREPAATAYGPEDGKTQRFFYSFFRVFLCAFASLRQVIIINQAFPIYNIEYPRGTVPMDACGGVCHIHSVYWDSSSGPGEHSTAVPTYRDVQVPR